MKTKYFSLILAGMLFLTACTVRPAPVSTSAETKQVSADPSVVFKTAVGDLVYISSRFTQEVNGVKPAPGCKLLLVELKRADQKGIDLQQFVDAHMQVFIRGEDGSDTLSTMGGFAEGAFVIGFQVPETIQTYRLIWGENPPLEIIPG